MTEDEAKTKLCPHSATFNADGPWPWSSVEDELYPTRCIASACMAWREIAVMKDVLSNGATPEPGQVYMLSSVVKQNRHVVAGYCGLAGSPS